MHLAQADGFSKFLVIATHVQGYRRPDLRPSEQSIVKRSFRDHPYLREALLSRPRRYNEALDRLLALEASGDALVIWPDEMPVESSTLDRNLLEVAFAMGRRQGLRELGRIREFVGL